MADTPASSMQLQRLRRVAEYVSSHIETEITLDGMAKIACMSRFHFVRAFKSHMGTTPYQYVSQLRIEHAKGLLHVGERRLAVIAETLQFSSQSTFTRAFRKATGFTPLQYAANSNLHGLTVPLHKPSLF